MRFSALLLFLLFTLPALASKDSTAADTAKRVRRSEAFLCIGGPQQASVDYAYRALTKTDWLGVNVRLGLGGSSLGTAFHFGATAIVSPWRFKGELGGGLVFAQLDEWAFVHAGLRYEGKRGMLLGLSYAGRFDRGDKAYVPIAQVTMGWRF